MPIVPDWDALKRPLRPCAIGALVLLGFLAAWQFLIPGDHENSLAVWAFMLGASVCLSSGVGLAMSATRRLWRSTRRARSLLPGVFLIGAVVAFPSAADAVGAHRLWVDSLLLALLVSAVFSAYLIVTAKDAVPRPSPPTDFNTDEPDAYVVDIPGKRKTG